MRYRTINIPGHTFCMAAEIPETGSERESSTFDVALMALDDEIERLRTERDSQQRVCISVMEERDTLAATVERLRAEVAALRADAERYRWMRNRPDWIVYEQDVGPNEIDAAIDAAMKERK